MRDEMTAERRRAALAARLDAIEQAAERKALPRGAAADLVRDEIVGALPEPRKADDRLLLWRAELLRARLCFASAAKTPLDAATALLYASEHDAALPAHRERSEQVAPLARAILERLRPLRSKRRAFRIFVLLADALAVAPGGAVGVVELFDLAPAYLDGATRRFARDVVGELLDKLGAALARDPVVEPDVRDRLRARLFGFALDLGDARRALDAWPGAAFVPPSEVERLAVVAAGAPTMDDEVLGAVENGLRLGEEARRRLERPLRDRSRVDAATPEDALPSAEWLNRRMASYYADEGWPWLHLVRIAARRGRVADACAAFARLAEASADLDDAPRLLAPLLLRAGFRRLSAELAAGPVATLARAELALDGDPRLLTDELADALERVLRDEATPDVLKDGAAKLRGRLAAAAGRASEAVEHFERALSRAPGDAETSADLAEALAAAGHVARAAAFVDAALESGSTPRLLELKAAALESEGRVADAAATLKRAVDLDAEDSRRAEPDERATVVSEAERAYARHGRRGPEFSPFLARLRADAETAAPAVRRGLARPELARRRAAHLADRAERPRDVLALLAPWRARLAADEGLSVLAARAATAIDRPADALELLRPFGDGADVGVRTARGEALTALGRHAEAARELEAARAAGDVDRAGAALVRLDLARGSPETALERCALVLAECAPSPAATALIESLRAEAHEARGDAIAALKACAASLERFESDATRVRYARIAVTAGLSEGERAVRDELLAAALDAVKDVTAPGACVWASVAALALGRPSPLPPEETADLLADLRLDCGPGGRSRVVVDAWLRERLEAPPSEIAGIWTTPEPVATAGTDTRTVGPFE